MHLSVPNCPTCHQPAIGSVERISGIAVFTAIEPDGSVEYEGETRVDWDGQETRRGPNQLPLLTCGEHQWESQIDESWRQRRRLRVQNHHYPCHQDDRVCMCPACTCIHLLQTPSDPRFEARGRARGKTVHRACD